jgi:hypothetical protein
MNAFRRRSTLALVIATQVVCGCARLNAKTTEGPPSMVWPAALGLAQQRATDGRLDAADSALAEYAIRHPGTSEALETAYWRALYKLDPNSPRTSLTSAMASLDAYLGDSRPRQHVAEATVLRRLAGELDGLSKQAAAATAQAKDATVIAANAKAQAADAKADAKVAEAPPTAEEFKKMKDELAKANAELERIRKRLSQPPPAGPP